MVNSGYLKNYFFGFHCKEKKVFYVMMKWELCTKLTTHGSPALEYLPEPRSRKASPIVSSRIALHEAQIFTISFPNMYISYHRYLVFIKHLYIVIRYKLIRQNMLL